MFGFWLCFDPACFIGWECRVVQFDKYPVGFEHLTFELVLTSGVIILYITIIHILYYYYTYTIIIYYILYIYTIIIYLLSYTILSSSVLLSSPFPFPSVLFLYSSLPLFYSSIYPFLPIFSSIIPFPIFYTSLLIQSIRVGTSISLFIFQTHRII